MHHEVSLITTVAMGLVLAFAFGFTASRLRLPPLVGYLLAGVALGPYTPGLEADLELAAQLAEIGVILLMFGVGLHFSLKDLFEVRKIALPGAIAQIGAATVLGIGLGLYLDWSLAAGIVFGVALSTASTVVLLRALESRNMVVPGLIAVIGSIIAALLTALTIAREWERGTMEQLVSTPVREIEIVAGKLLPYLVIGLVDVAWFNDAAAMANPDNKANVASRPVNGCDPPLRLASASCSDRSAPMPIPRRPLRATVPGRAAARSHLRALPALADRCSTHSCRRRAPGARAPSDPSCSPQPAARSPARVSTGTAQPCTARRPRRRDTRPGPA